MPFIQDTLNELVQKIEVHTTLGPNLVIDEPFKPGESAVPSAAMKILKPSVFVYQRGGGDLLKFAPYGDPGITKWPFLIFGIGGLIGWLGWRAFGRK